MPTGSEGRVQEHELLRFGGAFGFIKHYIYISYSRLFRIGHRYKKLFTLPPSTPGAGSFHTLHYLNLLEAW